jgi:hypothetical protein
MVKQSRFDPTKEYIIELLERFVSGATEGWEWNDFVGVRITNPELEGVRQRCLQIAAQHPSGPWGWCNTEGMDELSRLARSLREAIDP